MKACSFCGCQTSDKTKTCASCGSDHFLWVCPNCSNKYEGKFCPSCGVAYDAPGVVCPNCGNKYYTKACPDCGYTASSGGNQTHTASLPKNDKRISPPNQITILAAILSYLGLITFFMPFSIAGLIIGIVQKKKGNNSKWVVVAITVSTMSIILSFAMYCIWIVAFFNS